MDEERHIRLCDFGFARAVETRGRASTVCLPVDHELLSSRGWLDCAAYLRLAATDPELRLATYDAAADALRLERPLGHQLHAPQAGRELVQLGEEAAWAAGGGDLCYRATADHRLFVQPGELPRDGCFAPFAAMPCKVPAGEVLAAGLAVRHVTAARNGVAADPEASWREPGMPCTAERDAEAAFLALCGFWLLRGRRCGDAQVRFATASVAESAWVHQQLARCGLAASAVSRGAGHVHVADEGWACCLGPPSVIESAEEGGRPRRAGAWLWRCGAAECRAVLAGVQRAAGGSECAIAVVGEELRDDLVRLLLMAGRSAAFERLPDGSYRLEHSGCEAAARPVLPAAAIGRVESPGAVWCVEMPSGLLWARRARRDAETGRVVQVRAAARAPVVTRADSGRTGVAAGSDGQLRHALLQRARGAGGQAVRR